MIGCRNDAETLRIMARIWCKRETSTNNTMSQNSKSKCKWNISV